MTLLELLNIFTLSLALLGGAIALIAVYNINKH
jgi:hypothetical protein